MEIFADRGDEAAVHALALQAEHHDDVGVAQAAAHVGEDLDAHALDADGQEGRRADDADARAERVEEEDVGAGDAAVGDVAADGDGEAADAGPCGGGW